MNSMRESWTDKRLDDLSSKVDRGFDRLDADLRSLRAETKSGFEGMEERFDARFDALHRLLIQLGGLLTAALIGLIATQL